jgi:hypothetical protein
VDEYENAPRLLTISWDYFWDQEDSDLDHVLFDITLLLRLRAFCPTSVVNFVPHRITECDYPNADCSDCGHSLHCGCNYDECDHDDAMDEAQEMLNNLYAYTDTLDEVLAHNNEAWLKTLRDTSYSKSMKVQVTIVSSDPEIVVYIRFDSNVAPAYFTKKTMHYDAVKYLHDMGMLGLICGDAITFFVCGETGKYTRHSKDCGIVTPMYDQMEISGETVYKPETAADLEASQKTLCD